MSVVQINELTKMYGKHRGIKNVSFSIEEGEIFGFIGPNGAGKSTTIRLLLSLIYPTSGTATIFGKDCFKEGADIRKEVGYLPSEVFYYDRMKVKELLYYSASFYEKCDKKRIEQLADTMELDLNRKIDDLSFGNKKKVGVVQALLHKPKLIILDEPTSGLDPLMQQKFFDLIREENEQGATVLFSSHILTEVQKMCDRVAIIREGEIVEVQDMMVLQSKNYKKIKLVDFNEVDQIKQLDGVSSLEQNNEIVTFFYQGDVGALLSVIANNELKDVLIEEPTLEEVFMHYYQ